ncbi:hypothetical protein BJX64DRAFT_291127 [Aspergillus heterothallicus]
MFGWSSQFPGYYQIPSTQSDPVAFPQFVSNDTSSAQPNVDLENHGPTPDGLHVPQMISPIQERGNQLQQTDPRQGEQSILSDPSGLDTELEDETNRLFAAMLRETRRSTAKVSQTAEKLGSTAEQLNELRAVVEQLREKVSRLEERSHQDHQCVDSMISNLKNYRGLFDYLVHRLSVPIGFDGKLNDDPVINNDFDDFTPFGDKASESVMASTAAEGLLGWEAQPHLVPASPPQQDSWQMSATNLIKELSDLDQSSHQYQTQLESRLREEQTYLQQERQHSSLLQQRLADLQWSRSQLESELYRATNDIKLLRQELDFQTRKSHEAESRVTTLSAVNEYFSKMIFDGLSGERTTQAMPPDVFQIRSDILKHQEWIKELHFINCHHEESIQTLRADLHAALLTTSHFGSSHGSDSSGCTTIVGTGGHFEGGHSSIIPPGSDLEPMHNDHGSSKKKGSWYEE